MGALRFRLLRRRDRRARGSFESGALRLGLDERNLGLGAGGLGLSAGGFGGKGPRDSFLQSLIDLAGVAAGRLRLGGQPRRLDPQVLGLRGDRSEILPGQARLRFVEPALAEPCEARADRGDRVWFRQPAQVRDGGWRILAHGQDAETVAVQELKAWVTLGQLAPQSMDTEIIPADVGVMEQYHRSVGQLRQPGLEVVPDGLIGVQPVNVQEVDGAILNLVERLVEGATEQGGEGAEPLIMEAAQFLEYLFAVLARLMVAAPGVNGVAADREVLAGGGLAERSV